MGKCWLQGLTSESNYGLNFTKKLEKNQQEKANHTYNIGSSEELRQNVNFQIPEKPRLTTVNPPSTTKLWPLM